PAVFVMIALGIDRARAALVELAGRELARLMVFGLVAMADYHDLDHYFRLYPERYAYGDLTWQARYVQEQDRSTVVRTVGAPVDGTGNSDTAYLGYGMDVADLSNPTIELPGLGLEGRPLATAVNRQEREWVPILRYYLPDAIEEPRPDARRHV